MTKDAITIAQNALAALDLYRTAYTSSPTFLERKAEIAAILRGHAKCFGAHTQDGLLLSRQADDLDSL